MAKRNLLGYVQNILSSMDADSVNSIGDTDEAMQIADIVEEAYFNLLDEFDFKYKNDLFTLHSSSNPNKPTHMRLPDNVQWIETIKYNVRRETEGDITDRYRRISYVEPEEFLGWIQGRNPQDDFVEKVEDFSGIELFIRNNKSPEYWTSFDDEWVVFDSWDKEKETTMQSSKTLCFGPKRPSFIKEDSFVPDLPENLVSLLLVEAKSLAMAIFAQETNPVLQDIRTRLRRNAQINMNRQKGSRIKFPDYGRK